MLLIAIRCGNVAMTPTGLYLSKLNTIISTPLFRGHLKMAAMQRSVPN